MTAERYSQVVNRLIRWCWVQAIVLAVALVVNLLLLPACFYSSTPHGASPSFVVLYQQISLPVFLVLAVAGFGIMIQGLKIFYYRRFQVAAYAFVVFFCGAGSAIASLWLFLVSGLGAVEGPVSYTFLWGVANVVGQPVLWQLWRYSRNLEPWS